MKVQTTPNGYGKVLVEEREFEKAEIKYGAIVAAQVFDKFTPDSTAAINYKLPKIYVQALLSLGDIYNYRYRKAEAAFALYKKAGLYAQKVTQRTIRRRLIAQSCLGIGDTFRLRMINYDFMTTEYLL